MNSSRGASIFVWLVWAGMVAVAGWHFAHYAHDIPLAEDWNLVAPMTGHEPNLGAWLWSQNNEHRLPFPRLVMLGLLKVSGGDFRSGMIFSITMVALLAAGMIAVLRRARGGRLQYADAFFPIVLLEVGDWQNLFWHWQLAFVLSVVLFGVAILALISRPGLTTPGAATAFGAALVLAPLTGGTGLLFVPPLLLYAGWRGMLLLRTGGSHSERRAGAILVGSVALGSAIIAVYLASYDRPDWVPANPGLGKSLLTAVQFQTLGLGPAVRTSWNLWAGIAMLVLLAAAAWVARAILPGRRSTADRDERTHRLRAAGLFACLLSVAGFAAGIGWGRAAVIDVYHGWPDRYVLLAAPAFCLAYLAFALVGGGRAGQWGQWGLFALAGLLLPMNTAFGREWGAWYVGGMKAVTRDIHAGTPRDVLASRHREFLYHAWEPTRLAEHMQMLHDGRVGPFSRMVAGEDTTLPPDLESVTIRYHLPHAGAVQLIWWFRDGRLVPVPIRPPGTMPGARGSSVSTPMQRDDSAFTLTLRVPPGDSLEYGFLITARNDGDTIAGVWDGSRAYTPDTAGLNVVEAQPDVRLLTNPLRGDDTVLVRQRIRYGPTDARRVRVVWGIDGWQRLPDELLPPRTRTAASHLSLTAMTGTGSTYEVTLPVPAGRRLEFAFQLDRADRYDVDDGGSYTVTPTGDSTMTIVPRLGLAAGSSLGTVLWTGTAALLALGVLAVLTWLSARPMSS